MRRVVQRSSQSKGTDMLQPSLDDCPVDLSNAGTLASSVLDGTAIDRVAELCSQGATAEKQLPIHAAGLTEDADR